MTIDHADGGVSGIAPLERPVVRASIVVSAGLLLSVLGVVGVRASMDPRLATVTIAPPEMLFNEPENRGREAGGTWSYVVSDVTESASRMTARLRAEFAAVDAAGPPGPAVVFWQFAAHGTVPETSRSWARTASRVPATAFLDQSARLDPEGRTLTDGPVEAVPVLERCEAGGECALEMTLDGSIASIAEAAATLDTASVGSFFTIVRTFDGGRKIQVMPPLNVFGGDAGTLSSPERSWGTFFQYRPFRIGRASPSVSVLTGWSMDPEGGFDYAGAVRDLIRDPRTDPLPAPVDDGPIAPWTPGRDVPGIGLRFDAGFLAPCPIGYTLIATPSQGGVFSRVTIADLGGRSALHGQVKLPDDENGWTVEIIDAASGPVIAETIEPGPDVHVTGTIDCRNGKGAWEWSRLPVGTGPRDPEDSDSRPVWKPLFPDSPPPIRPADEPWRNGATIVSVGIGILTGLLLFGVAALVVSRLRKHGG